EGAPTAASVTASVYGGAVWARVDASFAHLSLSAPGATPSGCDDIGTPWSAGGTATCSIVFDRSSANQTVKAGHSVPTSTLTATSTWTAQWVSSANAAPQELPDPDPVTTTAEVPVAEVQSVVTGS
ncbi:hypothetical protein, partial [Cellulomonas rhizosphaerae]